MQVNHSKKAKQMHTEFDDEEELDAIDLFEVRATHGPNWVMSLSNLEIEQTDLCDEKGNVVHGITDPSTHRSVINAADPLWIQEETMFHELLHQMLDDSGIGWLTEKREEMFVQYLSPRLFDALCSLGFRWPKRPKECEELCRQSVLNR